MTNALRYATADDAAVAALNAANPRSIHDNKEYGGLIFREGAGRYGFTPRRLGTRDNVSLAGIRIPHGATEVGNYHCHGDYAHPDPRDRRYMVRGSRETEWLGMQSDLFGPNDVPASRARARGVRGYRAYLGTPSLVYYYYDVDTRRVAQVPMRPPQRATP